MAIQLEKSDFRKLTTVLQNLTEFANERDRQRFLQGALASEPRADNILKHLDASGAPALAAVGVVQHFVSFGQLEPGRVG